MRPSRFHRGFALTVAAACGVIFSPPAGAVTFLNGIDVSNFQGTITWSSVKNAGYSFAFAKATEGVDFVDAKFTTNMTNAKNAGVYIGPYHFARPDSFNTNPSDAANEANDFVDAIRPYYATGSPYYLRPVIDVEALPSTSWTTAQNKTFLSNWIRNFAAVVVDRLGVQPLIYANTNYAANYLETNINQFDFWLANYNYAPPSVPPASASGIFGSWDIWQYSSTGTVAGISGNVDHDVTTLSLADFVTKFQVAKNSDFNLDNKFDGADFLTWQRNRDVGTTHSKGDADYSGTVTSADLVVWQSQFGGPAAATPSLGAVPEPTASVIIAIATGILGAWRTRTARG